MTNTNDTEMLELEVSHLIETGTVIASFGVVVGALLAAQMAGAIAVGAITAAVSYFVFKK